MPIDDFQLRTFLITALWRVSGTVIIFLVGRWLAMLVRRSLRMGLERTHASPSITLILERSVYYGILLLAAFGALVFLGIPAEVLVTVIGVVVIVAAVALRESLRDLAATVIFIIFQPFQVGDRIETNGIVGDVQEILLFNTVLITLDHRKLIVPNGNIQNTNLINYSALDKIRLDLPVSVSYRDDVLKAKETLLRLAAADERVLRDPAPVVDVMELGTNGLSIVLRVYATPENFWALRPFLNQQIKLEFDKLGLTFPFPQLDIHMAQPAK
jgi:small conductance mechanosensitive channel